MWGPLRAGPFTRPRPPPRVRRGWLGPVVPFPLPANGSAGPDAAVCSEELPGAAAQPEYPPGEAVPAGVLAELAAWEASFLALSERADEDPFGWDHSL